MPTTRPRLTLLAALLLLLLTRPAAAAPALTPLAGSYTVGGFNPNYATLSAAVADLNSRGTSAPVTFRLSNGSTFDEQITITAFTRTGAASDPVVFQRASPVLAAPRLTASAQSSVNDFIVRLDGASYIELHGLEIERDAGVPAGVGTLVRLEGGAHHLTISNSTLTGELGGGDSLVYQAEIGAATGSRFTGNELFWGDWAIEFDQAGAKSPDLVITDNVFSGQASGGADIRSDDSVIDGNRFSSAAWSTASYIALLVDDFGPTITRNVIDMQRGTAGIWLFTVGGSAIPVTITNNMISLRGSDSDYGIYVAQSNVQIEHNTIYVGQAAPTTSTALLLSASGALDVAIHNNILYHASGGRALAADAVSVSASDANNLYTTGGVLVRWEGGDYATLGDYRDASGFDGRSSSAALTFVDTSGSTDLHLAPASAGDDALAALALATVTTDIDGDARGTPLATIGADEGGPFVPLSNDSTAAGFYTVGGATPDFANPNQALAALNRRGMQGAVTFRIRAGNYNLHRDLVYTQFGAGAPYTLTLRAANLANPPTLRHAADSSGDNYLLRLDDRAQIVLHGLTLEATGTSICGRLLDMRGDTSDVVLRDSTLNGLTGTSSDAAALVYADADRAVLPDSHLQYRFTFAGNTFNAGSHALYLTGALFSGNGVTHHVDANDFRDQTVAAVFSDHSDMTLTNNTLQAAGDGVYGFNFAYGDSHNAISGNRINLPGQDTVGIFAQGSAGTLSVPTTVANNFISANDTVWLDANSTTWRIVHNTLLARNHALRFGPDTSAAVTVGNSAYNNILGALNGVPLYVADTIATLASDYNNLRPLAGGDVAHFNGSNYATLAAYRAASGLDAHSINRGVTYVDSAANDLHLAGASVGDVALAGTPLAYVPTDIDGAARSARMPYMGADEAATPLAPPTAVTLRAAAAGGELTNLADLSNWLVLLGGVTFVGWLRRLARRRV